MEYRKYTGPDEIMATIASLARVVQGAVDWAGANAAVAEHRKEQVERWRDQHTGAGWRADTEIPSQRLGDDPPADDPEAIHLRLNSTAFVALARFGQDLQRVVEAWAPITQAHIDAYLAETDPPTKLRIAVIARLRILIDELGLLARDHSRMVEDDLRRLQAEILPYERHY